MDTRLSGVHVIVPALNEELALPLMLDQLRDRVESVVVVDNGSEDDTAIVARGHGAHVVSEPKRGYGAACLAGLTELRDAPDTDIVAFFDADGSDDPAILPKLTAPIEKNNADFVLASRVLESGERGSLSMFQRMGNAFACRLIARAWGVRYTDLAPCRAIRLAALRALRMTDRDFGWTIEMQIRAAKHGLRVVEIPSRYRRRRAGQSKISGTVLGSFRAGATILRVIGRELVMGR